MSVGQWTTETYRLDEVTRKFSLPCVVSFSEGYMDATECESISKDDIIKIDKRVMLQKVAADFVGVPDEMNLGKQETLVDPDDPYVQLRVDEILIPLNYGGTVQVLHNERICFNVLQLHKASPRYAKTLTNVTAALEDGRPVTIQAGSMIEIDRFIPGNKNKPDRIVVCVKESGNDWYGTLPVTGEGRFKTLADHNDYTLDQVVNRYGFPVVVKFLDDEIQRIYTTDIEEGIDNMKLISVTVRLKRLEMQDALIAHYKPLEEDPSQKPDSEYFARRSLVVLPLDNSEIREIQVHVLQDTDEEIYDQIFLVTNKSTELNDVIDGTLYVDFVRKAGPRRITIREEKRGAKAQNAPPPRPPKSTKCFEAQKSIQDKRMDPRLGHAKGMGERDDNYFFVNTPNPAPRQNDDGYLKPTPKQATKKTINKPKAPLPEDDFEDYEEVAAPPIGKVTAVPTAGKVAAVSPLAEMNFNKYGDAELKEEKTSHLGETFKKMKKKVFNVVKDKLSVSPLDKTPDIGIEDVVYDYPDAEEMISIRQKLLKTSPSHLNKPVAYIPPQNKVTGEPSHVKAFSALTVEELEHRLMQCGMKGFAAVCREENLDGKFFDTISKDALQIKPFQLNDFELLKLDKIKEGWIPN